MESSIENIDSVTYRRQVGNKEEIWRTFWTEEAPVSRRIAVGGSYPFPFRRTGYRTGLLDGRQTSKPNFLHRFQSFLKRTFKRS